MSDPVSVTIDGQTATITLQDPEVRNALSVEMAEGLEAAVERVEDSDVRCLVVEGAGGHFCAGGDIEAMVDAVSRDVDVDRRIEEFAVPVNDAVQAVAECPIPTVAKVDGAAAGAGGALAIACDVLLASERAKLSFAFRQVGLSVDSGTSVLLSRLVGDNVAKELVFTGELIDSERARELGLFNHVYPVEEFDARVAEFVDRIASGPTVALAESKRLIEAGHDRTVGEAIEAERESLRRAIASPDHAEGVSAFFEDRDPDFEGK